MGTVTPYSTAAGKRYRVRYRKPDHRQTDKRGFKSKREAELYLASVEVSKARGEYINAAESRADIAALGRTWLAAQTHLKASSFEPLEISWRLYVQPRWGATAVGDIRHSEVKTWVSQLSGGTAPTLHPRPGPRSATVVIRAHGILAAVLDAAVLDRRIPSNPARHVTLPRKTKKPHVYLSHEQLELLASSARTYSALIRVMGYTGVRWGEAIGLRVADVDQHRRRLRVNENAVRVGGKTVVGTVKNNEFRFVPYPAFLSSDIEIATCGKSSHDLLFGSGANHLKTPAVDGWFFYAQKRARAIDSTIPRLTPHDLRHTAASLAISAGANVKAIQRMLGHKSAAMTLDVYADLFDDDLDAVAVALNDARSNSNVSKMWALHPLEAVRAPDMAAN